MQRDTASAQQLAQEALKKNSDYRPGDGNHRARPLPQPPARSRALRAAGHLDGFGEENPARDKDNAEAHFLRGLILKEEGRRVPSIE